MNYVIQTIIEILEKRFANDKPYLSEKLEELATHENKYDRLNFLCTKADKTTIEMYSQKTKLTVENIQYLKDIWYKI